MVKHSKIAVCPLFQIEGNLIYFEFVCFFPKKESNWQTDLNEKRLMLQLSVAMMSWVRVWVDFIVYYVTDSEVFILFEEIKQILLKISFIPIFLTFMYLSSSTLSENWVVNNLNSQVNSNSNSTHHCDR